MSWLSSFARLGGGCLIRMRAGGTAFRISTRSYICLGRWRAGAVAGLPREPSGKTPSLSTGSRVRRGALPTDHVGPSAHAPQIWVILPMFAGLACLMLL